MRLFVCKKNREGKSNLKMKVGGKEIKLRSEYTPLLPTYLPNYILFRHNKGVLPTATKKLYLYLQNLFIIVTCSVWQKVRFSIHVIFLCLITRILKLDVNAVEATKMCIKVRNLPQVSRNIHLDTLYKLRKRGSSASRQLVYSN